MVTQNPSRVRGDDSFSKTASEFFLRFQWIVEVVRKGF